MKVKGLDGKTYTWKLVGHKRDSDTCSSLHNRARAVLAKLYPFDQILEEVLLPSCGTSLFCDFYLPLRHLMVEVQGQQHYKHIPHFHGQDSLNFLRGQHRDRVKRRFCELNNLNYVELPFDKDDDEWTRRISESVT